MTQNFKYVPKSAVSQGALHNDEEDDEEMGFGLFD